ncbi:hypothetical protein N665_1073s0014 [Sinapis alba]|nr:hypothetical protein N665_1073s0014 [Sinapis alba]
MWIKPDQTLTNELEEEENNNKSTRRNTMLVAIPSSYSPHVRTLYLVGLEMGGCNTEESKNWGEVFDTNTQTWESLPDPGPELRFSLVKTMNVTKRRVYVESSEKTDHYYDPKEGRWGVSSKAHKVGRTCEIGRVRYTCGKRGFFWYDKKLKSWRMVKGLEVLNKYCCVGVIAIANYGGKLLILWDKFEQHDQCQNNKEIWCSVIALEIRSGGDEEVWGIVEWASVVLTVPSSYVFLRCQVKPV